MGGTGRRSAAISSQVSAPFVPPASSLKVENHAAAVALYAMHYNFCRVHQTLRVTPAMEAGLTDRVWSLPELVGLLDCE